MKDWELEKVFTGQGFGKLVAGERGQVLFSFKLLTTCYHKLKYLVNDDHTLQWEPTLVLQKVAILPL